MKSVNLTVLVTLLAANLLFSQNAAVSMHTNFGTNVTGDIQISEVRVPSNGVTLNTYYETLGFWGNKGNSTGNGYGGIQESGDSRGNKVHIFSIWHALDNPNDTTNFPYPVYLGHGMTDEYFGGEGVGLKTWCLTSDTNHPLYWQPDLWYTHVIRAWDVSGHTYYGFFVRDGVSGKWRHLSTIGVKEANIRITGKNDTFLEDWIGSGQNMRETHLRGNWRRALDSSWVPAQSGDYSPNSWDFTARSSNYTTNWDGGTRTDATGSYYYMTSGGASTSPTAPLSYPNSLSATFSIAVTETEPGYTSASILSCNVNELSASELEVVWDIDSSTLPQFSYAIEVYDNSGMTGTPLVSESNNTPQARKDTLDISSLDVGNTVYYLKLSVIDILDNNAPPTMTTFGNGSITPYVTVQAPNGGESFMVEDVTTITWSTNVIGDQCDIILYDDGAIVDTLARVDVTTKSYSWTIASTLSAGSDYMIKIAGVSHDSVTDISNTTFAIAVPDSSHMILGQEKLVVHSFDSEQNSTSDAADNVLDGDAGTIWHTDWTSTAVTPHEIVLKADNVYTLTGLVYLPRQDGANGRIGDYEIYVSSDGISWGRAVISGAMPNTGVEQTIDFPAKAGQYIKLIALSEISGQAWTSIAELNVLYDASDVVVPVQAALSSKPSSAVYNYQAGELSLTPQNSGVMKVSLYSVNGRKVYSVQRAVQAGVLTSFYVGGGLSKGVYLMTLQTPSGLAKQRLRIR